MPPMIAPVVGITALTSLATPVGQTMAPITAAAGAGAAGIAAAPVAAASVPLLAGGILTAGLAATIPFGAPITAAVVAGGLGIAGIFGGKLAKKALLGFRKKCMSLLGDAKTMAKSFGPVISPKEMSKDLGEVMKCAPPGTKKDK